MTNFLIGYYLLLDTIFYVELKYLLSHNARFIMSKPEVSSSQSGDEAGYLLYNDVDKFLNIIDL